MKKNYFLILFVFAVLFSNAQKIWTGGGATNQWSNGSNWSGGTVPVSTDDVVFNNTGSPWTVTFDLSTTISINSLTINGSTTFKDTTTTSVNFNLGGAGMPGTALSIAATKSLTLNSSVTASIGFILSVPTGYTANINGSLSLASFGTGAGVATGQINQLLSSDANSVQVNSGGGIVANSRNSGYPFGATGTNNAIVFNSGSSFTHYGGSGPWGSGTSGGAGIAKFNTGSTFNVFGSNNPFNPGLGGRTLGKVVFGCGCGPILNVSNNTNVTTTIDSLVINGAVTVPLFAATPSSASPSYALGYIGLSTSGGSSTTTLSLRNESGVTPSSYTISGNIVLGTSTGTATSTLNLGSVNFGSGSGTTNITFTGVGKSISVGSVGTQNLNIGSNSGTAAFTTNLVVQANADLTVNRNFNLSGAFTTTSMLVQPLGSLAMGAGKILTVGTGATLTNNGTFTLQSNDAGTASIGNSSGTITGNVTVQRYIPEGRRTSRFLDHPFSNTLTMASLIDNIYVTGGNYLTGFDSTGTQSPSSFWFDNGVDQAWKAFTTTSDASWTQYRGIRVLVRGDRTQTTTLTSATPPAPNAVTLDMTGTLNTGAQNITVPTGYSVFGNPYPSPVNLGARLFATTNIGTQFWYWDAKAGPTAGAYRTRLIGAAENSTLPMSGAFVVQPAAATSIAFVEADKVATDSTNLFRTSTQSGVLELQVLYNNYPADNLFVRFNNTSNDSKDALDGEKLNNPEVNFYALSTDSKKLSLDTSPFAENKIIPLCFTATAANSFKIKVADYGITEAIYLKDKYLNTITQLLAGTEYSFSVDPSNAATLGNNRFEIVMRNNNALPATFLNVTAAQKNAGIEVSWTTANETNMSNYEVEESTDGNNFSKATSVAANNATTNVYNWFDASIINGDNYYRIKAIEKNGTAKYSNVVKVKIGGKGAGFTVYPNPVKGGVVSLQMSNVEKGIYTVKIFNNIGQELAAKAINHNGGSATQTIDLGKGIASGTYNMQITNGTKTVITKTVIVE